MSAKNYAKKTRSGIRRAVNRKPTQPTIALRTCAALERIADSLAPRASLSLAPPATPKYGQRFTKVSAAGALLPDAATEWEGVYDATTALIWGRKLLSGTADWKDSLKKAGAASLCGAGARAPTIQERLSIVDYGRLDPALDTNYFDASETSAWEWTSTAACPSGCAWFVYLGGGFSSRGNQSGRNHVRAVRAGQF